MANKKKLYKVQTVIGFEAPERRVGKVDAKGNPVVLLAVPRREYGPEAFEGELDDETLQLVVDDKYLVVRELDGNGNAGDPIEPDGGKEEAYPAHPNDDDDDDEHDDPAKLLGDASSGELASDNGSGGSTPQNGSNSSTDPSKTNDKG